MFLEQSCSSLPQDPSAHHLRAMMQRLKVPYLRKVQQAKNRFYDHASKFKMENQQQPVSQPHFQPSPQPTQQTIENTESSSKLKMENKRITTQSSFDETQNAPKEIHFGEWVMGQQKSSGFKTLGEMVDHYSNTFQKKVKFSKQKTKLGDSFILQEKLVIERIFFQIGNTKEQTADFKSIVKFFQQCPLFYTIYNIHPSSLLKILKDSAHHHQSKLTKNEFINLFLINNRSNEDFQRFNVKKSQKKCLFDEQKWKQIKQIAILFDTFGNETIQLKQFLNKIRINVQYKHLLDLQVLSFESINRTYTLKKILFQIQNKLNIGKSFLKWQQIKDLIINFQHIKDPTIDVIEKQKIKAGKITNFNNTYMVKAEVLDFMKQTFMRCPKYCDNFVKMTHFCAQFYEGEKSKVYLSQIVRTQPQIVNVKQVLNGFSKEKAEYLDLDQILEQFSLKVPNKLNEKHQVKKEIEFHESESEDQQFQRKLREQKMNKKDSEKQSKKTNAKPTQRKQITATEEFNLSKKTKESIRDKKLHEMLQEKAIKERQECKIKIKANPIPASINHQNYQAYKKKLAENKQSIKSQLTKVNERDTLLLKYLEANTKLFEKPKIQSSCSSPTNYTFQHKPVPWFVHVNLLDKIKEQKENKIKELRRQTNVKYLNEWKKLPFCAQSAISSMQILPNTIRQCQKHNQQDFFSQTEVHSKVQTKSKVKEVPNFQALQKQFQQSLQKKKLKIKPTQVAQFNLTSPKNREKENQPVPASARPISQTKKKSVSPDNSYFIGSTLKYQSLVKCNQEKKILQEFHRQQLREEDKRRQKGKKMFAKLMRKQLRKQFKSSPSMNSKSRIASENYNNEKELADMYKRVFSRPFLFQEANTTTRSKFKQQNASKVNLGNQKSLLDKFMDQVQTEEIMYPHNKQEELELELISHQSI